MCIRDRTYTAHEVNHQLVDSEAEVLFTIPAFEAVAREGMQGTGCRELVLLGDWMGDPLPAQVPVDLDDHIVVLPYSSGTTGLPKGVMLSHRNLVVNVDQGLALIKILPDETLVAFLPFFHIYGMNVMMNTHPVSYTHLDVYKRQAVDRVIARQHLFQQRGLVIKAAARPVPLNLLQGNDICPVDDPGRARQIIAPVRAETVLDLIAQNPHGAEFPPPFPPRQGEAFFPQRGFALPLCPQEDPP